MRRFTTGRALVLPLVAVGRGHLAGGDGAPGGPAGESVPVTFLRQEGEHGVVCRRPVPGEGNLFRPVAAAVPDGRSSRPRFDVASGCPVQLEVTSPEGVSAAHGLTQTGRVSCCEEHRHRFLPFGRLPRGGVSHATGEMDTPGGMVGQGSKGAR